MVRRRTQRQKGGAGVKNETYMDALKRNYVFFYHKLKGEEVPKEKRFIEPEQEEEVRRVLLNAHRKGMNDQEIIRNIFKSNYTTFQKELSNWEEHKPSGFLNQGTQYERRAFPLAGSVGRFIGTIKASPRITKYRSDFMVSICTSMNFKEPALALSDKYCITVFTPNMRDTYEEYKGTDYPVSYIIVKPDFFPPRVTTSGGPITLNAKAIPAISFLLDAFQQDGIVEIEPTLYTTLQREAPELLRLSLVEPIVLITPELLSNASATKDRYMVVDVSALSRGRNVVQIANIPSKASLKQAFSQQAVYFMDPKTMYEIRKEFPELWISNFGAADDQVFRSLTTHEQLVFCFLQFKKMEELYSLSPTLASLQQAKQAVFGGGDPYELADNFDIDDEENLRQMIKLQDAVFHSVEIRTPDEVRSLLRKFDPTAAPQARREIGQRTYSEEILEQRKPLLKAYQNALQSAVSNSKIPSFLRTRKAKNANREQWRQRVRTAKAALLEFNRIHNLPFSRGAERYNI